MVSDLLSRAEDALRGEKWEEAVRLALAAAEDANPVIRARAFHMAAWVERHKLNRSKAVTHSAQAVEAAEKAGDQKLLMAVLAGAAHVAANSGYHDDCRRWAGRILEADPTPENRLHAHLSMAWSMYSQEDYGSAWLNAREAIAHTEPGQACYCRAHVVAALVACARGLPVQALRLLRDAQKHTPDGDYDGQAELALATSRAHLMLRDAVEAEKALTTAGTLITMGGAPELRVELLALMAWSLARDGSLQEARSLAREASRLSSQLNRPDLGALAYRTLRSVEDFLDQSINSEEG